MDNSDKQKKDRLPEGRPGEVRELQPKPLKRAALPVEPLPKKEHEDETEEAPGAAGEKPGAESEVLISRKKKELAQPTDDIRLREHIGSQHRRNYVSPAAIEKPYPLKALSWLLANPVRLIAASFAAVIFLGALLLCLPFASAGGQWTDFSSALFTSVSAVCVTGLIVVDTATYWSSFGHAVIICLIQIGGIGLITIVAAFFSFTKRKMNLKTLRAVQESTGSDSVAEVYRLVRRVLAVTFIVEFLGGLILSLRYMRWMPAGEAFYCGMFQGVSAFCNAGFDLLGARFGAYASLCELGQDPVILLVTAFLLTFGGIGFVVWSDLLDFRRTRKLMFHSKLILGLTFLILLSGTILFTALEYTNQAPQSLGTLGFGDKITAAFFQTATLRTAGFNSISQSALRDSSKILSILIMFIGAGPLSTGGGMKVSTVAIVAAGFKSSLKGRSEARLFRHKAPRGLMTRAFTIFIMGVSIAAASAFALSITERAALAAGKFTSLDLLFESMSALCTVGVTSIQTENISFWGRLPLILAMYIGRIGPFSFALLISLKRQQAENEVLPEARTYVG